MLKQSKVFLFIKPDAPRTVKNSPRSIENQLRENLLEACGGRRKALMEIMEVILSFNPFSDFENEIECEYLHILRGGGGETISLYES